MRARRRHVAASVVLATLAIGGCQSIAGLDDKHPFAVAGAGGTIAGAGGTIAGTGGTIAGAGGSIAGAGGTIAGTGGASAGAGGTIAGAGGSIAGAGGDAGVAGMGGALALVDTVTGFARRPPPRPASDSVPGPGATLAFAVQRFQLGQQALAPVPVDMTVAPSDGGAAGSGGGTDDGAAGASIVTDGDGTAWTHLGFDVDGVDTLFDGTAAGGFPATCREKLDKPPLHDLLVDGIDGRDNVFGAQVFSLANILVGSGNVEDRLAQGIVDGSVNNVIVLLKGVGDGPNDTFATAAIYLSGLALPGAKPTFDGTYHYPIDSSSITGNTVTTPKVKFLTGYVADDMFVSGDFDSKSSVPVLYLPLGPTFGSAVFHPATFTIALQLSHDHKSVLGGMISAVVLPTDVATVVTPLLQKQLMVCDSVEQETFLGEIDYLPDLLVSAPQFLDPTVMQGCDGISIGVGLKMFPVAEPADADIIAPLALTDPCAGAGGVGGSP